MEIFESVSRALAAMTGLGPTASHYGVLAIALVVVGCILSAVVAVCEHLSRLRALPMSFEKAQAPGISPAPVFWGGRWLPEQNQKYHFAITGTTRSGKSLLLSLYLRSVLSQITRGSDRRLILFDPKNELHPYIFDHAQVPVFYLLPSDRRSCRWDFCARFR